MLSLAFAVVLIALPDSVNPSLILTALYLAAGPHRLRRTAAFTAAAFAVTFAGGLAIALGLGDLILSLVPKPGATVKYTLILAAGASFVAGAILVWLRRKPLSRRRTAPVDPARAAHGRAALLGVGVAGIELLTAFPYFAAIAMIIGSGVASPGKLFLLGLYNVIYFLPLFGIVAVCAVMGDRAEAILDRWSGWVLARWPVFVAPLALVVGFALLAYGIAGLA